MSASSKPATPVPAAKPKRDSTARALMVAMFLAVAVTGGASLTSMGSGAFQDTLRTLGFGRETEIQAEQRKQAAVVAEMERIISRMDNEIGTLTTRVARTESAEAATSERLAKVDGGLASLGGDVRDLRARSEGANETWRKPVDHLNSAVTGARGDIVTLRSSLDAHEQSRRSDMNALTRRLDRLERAIAREVTSTIQNPPQRQPETPPPQSGSVLDLFGLRGSSATEPKSGQSGHMIDVSQGGH
jgi:chromosome segregation ATPase